MGGRGGDWRGGGVEGGRERGTGEGDGRGERERGTGEPVTSYMNHQGSGISKGFGLGGILSGVERLCW
jgi:hypothetical protein